MEWLKLKGVLRYDPRRPDFKKVHKQRTLIVELPRDQLDLYYQWFLLKQHGTWLTLQRPMYGLHVTVVKGNEKVLDSYSRLWRKHEGETVELEYSTDLRRKWQFWSLPVRSTKLETLRMELGLAPKFDFHITVGRHFPWQLENDLLLNGIF